MKRTALRALCVFALTLAASARAQVETTTAEALLERMERTYAAIKSYQDTTVANFRNPDGSAGAQAQCKVWFSRPNYFRIDGESRRAPNAPPRRDVIWADGNSARAWSSSRAVTVLDRIQLAGSKMFGTYAYHVPTMLERSYGGQRRVHEITSPSLNGEEELGGIRCHRVKGDWQGDPYELWIGQSDALLHKLTADYKGYIMEEVHRDIVIDKPIEKRVFQFAPEAEAAAAPASSPAPKKP